MKKFTLRQRATAILIAAAVVTTAFIGFRSNYVVVSGPSMEPTYWNHEIVKIEHISDTQANNLPAGKVVVFQVPGELFTRVKRIASVNHVHTGYVVHGLYGSTDEADVYSYQMFVVDIKHNPKHPPKVEFIKHQLKSDEYWVLSDNINMVTDSREIGPIKASWIVGVLKDQRPYSAKAWANYHFAFVGTNWTSSSN